MANMEEADYPKSVSDSGTTIVSMMEYCYSDHWDYSKVFNLYFYVYNPSCENIILNDGCNFVQIATEFQEGTAEPSKYEKLSLTYLDSTDDGLFYKFKLTDPSGILQMALSYASSHEGARRYIITELELLRLGADNAKAYDISKTYDWSGYASYCDVDKIAIDTLSCLDFGANSLPLTVNHTNYRFKNKGGYLYDDLSSVYFSIPVEYYQSWGDLTEIAAEWYEYYTSPMLVTSDKNAYSSLFELRNKFINEYGQLVDMNGDVLEEDIKSFYRVFWESSMNIFEYIPDSELQIWATYFAKSYNLKCRDDIDAGDHILDFDGSSLFSMGYLNGVESDWINYNTFSWLFYVSNADSASDYRITSKEVIDYARLFSSLFYNDEKIRGFSSSLFDLEKSPGYRYEKFFIDDSETYLDADRDRDWWSKFWFPVNIQEFSYSPIVTISAGDLILSPDEFSKKYLVNIEDAQNVLEYAEASYDKGEVPILLRFALRDYYASTARFDYAEETFSMAGENGYVAQEYVFLDFDVISLTFTSEDGKIDTVIGAVSSPIDIINGLTAPDDLKVENQNWWRIIIGFLILLVVLKVLSMFSPLFSFLGAILWDGLKLGFKIVFKIIAWPFKILGWFFGKLFGG